jgi:hypothetical protein
MNHLGGQQASASDGVSVVSAVADAMITVDTRSCM